jgi:tetratricopeptide (TPR) repeat protein
MASLLVRLKSSAVGWTCAFCVIAAALVVPASRALAAPRAPAASRAERAASRVDPVDEEARARFEAGRLAFEAGRFADALADFSRAYALSQRPQLLFNMGASCARLGQREQALAHFERYRNELPTAPNRVEVDARIAELSAALAAERARAAQARIPKPAPTQLERPPPPRWPWLLVGGGAAITAGGAALLGLALEAKAKVEHPASGSSWRDVEDDHAHVKPWSTAGSILLGVGAVTLASGLILRLKTKRAHEPRAGADLALRGLRVWGTF